MTRAPCVLGLPTQAMGCPGRSLPAWWTALALVALAAGLGAYDSATTVDARDALEIRGAAYRATASMGFPATLLAQTVSERLVGHGVERFADDGAACYLAGWAVLYACGLVQWIVAGWSVDGVMAWRRRQERLADARARRLVPIRRRECACGVQRPHARSCFRTTVRAVLASALQRCVREGRGP